MPEYYGIKIKGLLGPSLSDWLACLKVTHLEGVETLSE